MNRLSIIKVRDELASEVTYSGLAIDGIKLDEWLSGFVDELNSQPSIMTIKGLWLSLVLDLYSDTKIVWQYLGQLCDGAVSYVPLLVCPDDVDLSCLVVATEQYVLDNSIVWKRFGFVLGAVEEQNQDAIEWFVAVPELIFSRENFIEVFTKLLEEFVEAYKHQGEFLDINFPIDTDNYID